MPLALDAALLGDLKCRKNTPDASHFFHGLLCLAIGVANGMLVYMYLYIPVHVACLYIYLAFACTLLYCMCMCIACCPGCRIEKYNDMHSDETTGLDGRNEDYTTLVGS